MTSRGKRLRSRTAVTRPVSRSGYPEGTAAHWRGQHEEVAAGPRDGRLAELAGLLARGYIRTLASRGRAA